MALQSLSEIRAGSPPSPAASLPLMALACSMESPGRTGAAYGFAAPPMPFSGFGVFPHSPRPARREPPCEASSYELRPTFRGLNPGPTPTERSVPCRCRACEKTWPMRLRRENRGSRGFVARVKAKGRVGRAESASRASTPRRRDGSRRSRAGRGGSEARRTRRARGPCRSRTDGRLPGRRARIRTPMPASLARRVGSEPSSRPTSRRPWHVGATRHRSRPRRSGDAGALRDAPEGGRGARVSEPLPRSQSPFRPKAASERERALAQVSPRRRPLLRPARRLAAPIGPALGRSRRRIPGSARAIPAGARHHMSNLLTPRELSPRRSGRNRPR